MLSNAGDQVPVIPFNEVSGKVAVPPAHMGDTCVNVGTVAALTVMVTVSLIECAQVSVAVSVKVIDPEAVKGIV